MSEPSNEQAAGKHYLVCGTEDCQKNGQFYCNTCHLPLCEHCKDEHVKSPKTNLHEVVFYRHRKHELPVEKCNLHPTRNIDLFCKECKIALCSKCSTLEEHQGHKFDDLEEIYSKKYALQQGEFLKIQKYFLPTSFDLKTNIKEEATQIRKIMEIIRISMKTEAGSLKNLVDELTSENLEHTHLMEESLLEMLKSEETTYDEYISYLGNISDELQQLLSLTNRKLLFSETLKIKTIPETTKPIPPVFSAGQFNKDDISKLLGNVNFPNTKQEKRNVKPIEAVSAHIKSTKKYLEQSKEKSDMKQTLPVTASVTKLREYRIPGVVGAFHVSVDTLGRFWVSESNGNLVQTGLHGNLLQKIHTNGGTQGHHAATQDGCLIYTDKDKKVIHRITTDKKITEFIKTGDWQTLSVHSSRINGDILVGMYRYKERESKITRYSKTGKVIQNIQWDSTGEELYNEPNYISENNNGDICTSDWNKRGVVVVVNKSGQHKFSYTGQELWFCSHGICTDVHGHILVCDNNTIHLLDKDGQFLSVMLSPQQGIACPYGVCVDKDNSLYVGQALTNTVTMYKYLQ
uniref:Tripartite motif-containing protein 5-like n=1 Tax=Crassostrea virginica TaxID=6565 RepID=A0A8B8ERZ4_CRAVI|nr:tripartite motif-containing protein 5-like [Crassostrea virginica]